MFKPLSLLTACLFMTISAQAKIMGTYEVKAQATGGKIGRLNDFISALQGWSCSAYTEINFFETLRDHHGQLKQFKRESKSKSSYSLFEIPNIKTQMSRKIDAVNPQFSVEVGEYCSRTTYETVQDCTTDAKGNRSCTSRIQPKFESAYLSWDCKGESNPTSVRQSVQLVCPTVPMMIGDYNWNTALLTLGKQKRITGTITLTKVQEVYNADLCRNRLAKDAQVLSITQGVAGHYGENDFVINVNVNNQKVQIKQGSGILDYEVLVCGQSSYKVEASAIEDDLFFDDVYQAQGSGLNLDGLRSRSGFINLKRKSWTGWTDTEHQLRFDLRPKPNYSPNGSW